VTLEPAADGVTNVTYDATDGQYNVSSNSVTYTVFFEDEEQESSSSSSPSSGGGGGSSSSAVSIPIDRPEPYAIDIISPKPITIYENETVIAPLGIENTGETLLQNIRLDTYTDADVTLQLLDSTIDELHPGQVYNTSVIIIGFKYTGTYEVYVRAQVEEPEFNDTAVIFINSIERESEGRSVNTKVTYARDLLTANPACGELAQLLAQAEQAYRNGDSAQGEKLLTAVTEGCAFLRTQAAQEVQTPGLLATLAGYKHVNTVLGVLLALLLIVGGLLVYHYGRQQSPDIGG
jgi:hypothetical protein